jgi:hypothetical protein
MLRKAEMPAVSAATPGSAANLRTTATWRGDPTCSGCTDDSTGEDFGDISQGWGRVRPYAEHPERNREYS